MNYPQPRRFLIIWNDYANEVVEVDSGARRLYQGENDFEIAAALAVVNSDDRERAEIRDVKEI